MTPHQMGLLLMGCGVYFVVIGLTAKSLINETDVVATDEERADAKPTRAKRLFILLLGIGAFFYGFHSLMK
jgi:hypothetical protein